MKRVNINKNKEEGITTMKKNNLKMIVATSVLFLSGLFAKEMSGASGISSAKVAEGMENQSPILITLLIGLALMVHTPQLEVLMVLKQTILFSQVVLYMHLVCFGVLK